MRKLSLLLPAILCITLLKAQQLTTNNQLAVQQTIIKLFDALSNRDSVSIKAYSTTDVTFYEYGQVWNMDTLILKAITGNQSADFKRSNSFDFIDIKADKTIALVTYRLNSTIIRDGRQASAEWLETVVLVKERKPAYRTGRQWKVKHLHSTLIKRS